MRNEESFTIGISPNRLKINNKICAHDGKVTNIGNFVKYLCQIIY